MKAIIALLLVVVLGSVAAGETAEEAWRKLVEPPFRDWPGFGFVENDPRLPNVLIYGDSISMHYHPYVQAALAGKANVYRLHCNGGDSASFAAKMEKMESVMRDESKPGHWDFEWDVVQFNVGLHDLKYMLGGKFNKKQGQQVHSLQEYEQNLRKIIAYLKERAPGAQLIFATTTPVPATSPGRVEGDAARYNEVARRVLKDHPQILVNDLYAFTKPHQRQWWARPGDVHYSRQGRAAQGEEVARVITSALEQRAANR